MEATLTCAEAHNLPLVAKPELTVVATRVERHSSNQPWDSYEVWKRMIKEPRERQLTSKNGMR